MSIGFCNDFRAAFAVHRHLPDIPVYDIARQIVKMLVADIVGQPLPERHVVIQPKLLIRESTGGNHS
jgi:DNA-binding LacI/PurR family transcriptional regulator